jgi:transcriptional regulator with XRE-family HTH domain
MPMTERQVLGEAGGLEELAEVLTARRKSLGLTQLELDDRAGFQSGYTGKLEIGHMRGGRNAGVIALPLWLRALGVKLQVIAVEDVAPGERLSRGQVHEGATRTAARAAANRSVAA